MFIGFESGQRETMYLKHSVPSTVVLLSDFLDSSVICRVFFFFFLYVMFSKLHGTVGALRFLTVQLLTYVSNSITKKNC